MGYTNLGTVKTNDSGGYYNYVSTTGNNLNQSFKPNLSGTDTMNTIQFYGKSTGTCDVYLKTSGGTTLASTTFSNSTLQWQTINLGYTAVTGANTHYVVMRPRSGVTLYAYYANDDDYANGTGYQGTNANVAGTGLGIDLAFKITCYESYTTPTVTTTAASSIGQTSATVGGNVTSDGGATVTARGVQWGTAPSTYSNSQASGSGTGTFNVNLTSLSPGTTYYFRAYATNADGTSYGSEDSFTTTALPPVVTISAATGIDHDSADLAGNATEDYGDAITEKGFVYNTTGSPTTSDTKLIDGATGTGAYTETASGLTPLTKYYVKAYAINSVGTGYSSEINFTTLTGTPDVTTGAASSIATTSFTMAGNVTSDKGSTITARGFVYNTSTGPTLANSVKTTSGTTGAYSDSITGLTPGVKYYVKAYATNANGTTYGSEVEVVTLPTDPSGFTVSVTDKTTTSLAWTKGTGGTYTIVRRQAGSYPANINSGTLAYNGTASTFNDSGLTAGTNYFYRIWSSYDNTGTLAVSANYAQDEDTTVADFTNPTNVYTDDADYATGVTGDGVIKVKLSKDGGSNWTNQLSKTYTGSVTTEDFGNGATELWGTSWTIADLGSNFRLRVSCGTTTKSYQTYGGFDFSAVTGTNTLTGLKVSIKAAYSTNALIYFVKVTAYYGTSPIEIQAGSLAFDSTEGAPSYFDGAAWKTLAKAEDGYTDEMAQDAVGGMIDNTLYYTDGTPVLGVKHQDTATIDLSYDASGIKADVKNSSITEAMQSLADNTTNNVSNTKHGYVPKATDAAQQFLAATGAWATAPGRLIGVTTYTTGSGTHTVATGCTKLIAFVLAGGGGAGAADNGTSQSAAGGGGGAGGFSFYYTASPSGSYSYSVGGGGAGGVSNGASGSAGNNSTFGGITCNGGGAGTGQTPAGTAVAVISAGAGGSASGGTVNVKGGSGSYGIRLSGSQASGGNGGDSYFGAGGRGKTNGGDGENGGLGAGGGGGTTVNQADKAGGSGGDGIILVYEYY